MRERENVAQVAALKPDYMGFIFHPPSPRDVSKVLQKEIVDLLPKEIEPVAVFVNEDLDVALKILKIFGFKHAQLHGKESVEYCAEIKKAGFGVFKVFSVDESTDFSEMEKYMEVADYFLFDTKSPKHGGTGQKFDWNLLEKYTLPKPVLLSGGIGPEDLILIQNIMKNYSFIYGLDLNSRFEIEPGLKDVAKLKLFLGSLL